MVGVSNVVVTGVKHKSRRCLSVVSGRSRRSVGVGAGVVKGVAEAVPVNVATSQNELLQKLNSKNEKR